MKKINLIILIIATILTIVGLYFYKQYPIDYRQWGITLGASLIIAALYFSKRKSIRSKAAATAVRKSAGVSGVKKYANKMLALSLIASIAILIGTKNFQLLIPMGIALAFYALNHFFKIKVFLLISYISALFCAISFVSAPYIPIAEKYILAYKVMSFLIFLFYLLPAADLYCIDK